VTTLDAIKELHALVIKYGYAHESNCWATYTAYFDGMRAVVGRDGHHVLNGPGYGKLVRVQNHMVHERGSFTVLFNNTSWSQHGPKHEHLNDIDDWINWRLWRLQPKLFPASK